MPKTRWSDLLAKIELVGCDIQMQEAGRYYRGPISAVEQESGHVHFWTSWLASRPTSGDDSDWVEERSTPDILCGGATEYISGPHLDYSDDSIYFSLPYLGTAKIYLRGPHLVRRMVPAFTLETVVPI